MNEPDNISEKEQAYWEGRAEAKDEIATKNGIIKLHQIIEINLKAKIDRLVKRLDKTTDAGIMCIGKAMFDENKAIVDNHRGE